MIPAIRRLIEEWRAFVGTDHGTDYSAYRDGRNDALTECADDLESLLAGAVGPPPPDGATGDLLAYGQQEAATALASKDRDQYQFWQGWNAGLQRAAVVPPPPDTDNDDRSRVAPSVVAPERLDRPRSPQPEGSPRCGDSGMVHTDDRLHG